MQRYTGFVFLMAFVIGWSSVAFAVQKPIHQLMMSQSVKMNAAEREASHSMSSASHDMGAKHSSASPHEMAQDASDTATSNMNMQDCLQAKADKPSDSTQSFEHCQSKSIQFNSKAQCADCALWHCQLASVSLEMHAVELNLPEFYVFSEQPDIAFTAQYLPGHWQELLRPPKA